MLRIFCKSKIKNAVITDTNIGYDGSVGIDKTILEAVDIIPGEQVQILNLHNGERITTYAIEEKAGSGKIALYGPAARRGEVGDEVVILSYCMLETIESRNHSMRIAALGKNNMLKGKEKEK